MLIGLILLVGALGGVLVMWDRLRLSCIDWCLWGSSSEVE